MNIVELNQNEISVVSGGGKIVDGFNAVGGWFGGLGAAAWLIMRKAASETKGRSDENTAYWSKQFIIVSIAVGAIVNAACFYVGNLIFKPIDRLFSDDGIQK